MSVVALVSLEDKGTKGMEKPFPAFLVKLADILEDPESQHFIHWSASGETFIVDEPVQFAKAILPQYFKHSNFASFVRQLNLYGFHKTAPDPNWCEFRHDLFKRGQRQLMKQIRRKTSGNAVLKIEAAEDILEGHSIVGVDSKTEHDVARARAQRSRTGDSVMSDMFYLKNKQEDMENTLSTLRKENGLLWQELQISQQRQQFLQHSLSKIVARILDKLQSLDDVDSNKRKFTEVAGDSAAPSAAATKAVASPKMRQLSKSQRQKLLNERKAR